VQAVVLTLDLLELALVRVASVLKEFCVEERKEKREEKEKEKGLSDEKKKKMNERDILPKASTPLDLGARDMKRRKMVMEVSMF